MDIDSYKKMFLSSLICFSVSAFSVLLIPLSDFRGTVLQRSIAYMIGVLFWAGFITGLIITVCLKSIRKKDSDKHCKLPGVLCFFRNKVAVKCDISMIVSIMLLIIFQKLLGAYHIVSVILLAFMIFNIYIHSVFNGNNYEYMIRKGAKK